MKLNNIEILYSSEKCEILLGSGDDGRLYIRKNKPLDRNTAELLKSVTSPYIARLAEYDDNTVTCEYAEGVPLNDIRLTPDKVYSVFCELCEGLATLHAIGIIHRDIKPSNIILCNDGHIKLIDFDTARIKKPTADKDTSYLGTDGFAPPEQFGFSQTDERSDIYALGVTMQLLLGEEYQHSRYRKIIDKCIRFNPEERYDSIAAVKRALLFNKYVEPIIVSVAICAAICITALAILSLNKPSIAVRSEVDSSNISTTSASTSETIVSSSTENEPDELIKPSEYTISPDSVRPFKWRGLLLPEGFPKLADAVTEYSSTSTCLTFKWDIASTEETTAIVAILDEWAGGGVNEYSDANTTSWYWPDNETYSINVYRESDEWIGIKAHQLWITVLTPVPMDAFEDRDCSVTRYTLPFGSSRTVAWKDLPLPVDFPTLSDNVTAFSDKTDKSSTYHYEIKWDRMSMYETAVIADKIEKYYNCRFDIMMENGYTAMGAATQEYTLSITRISDEYAGMYGDNQVALSIWVF